ncbi:MAG: 50S ribosomal protein L25/general stress protein Ctc [Bacteroidales bacterium]|nr:50S ribosomal protein L25/general stress protein Ctc [Bacteroidales bacterium]
METIEIKGTIRENVGKKFTKQLRKELQVPCELYGGDENIHFYAHENDFSSLIYTPNVYIVKIKIKRKIYKVVLKDIQFHPVTDKILHIDFFEVTDDKKIDIAIPVKLHGLAQGVKQGGNLYLQRRKILVRAVIKDLPDVLNINIENLALGQTIKIGDLAFDNLELLAQKNTVVVSVKVSRISVEETEEEETTETAETEETAETVEASDEKSK